MEARLRGTVHHMGKWRGGLFLGTLGSQFPVQGDARGDSLTLSLFLLQVATSEKSTGRVPKPGWGENPRPIHPPTHPTLPETRVELGERVAHCGQPRPTNRERESGRCLRCLVDRSLLTRGEAGGADVSLRMIFCCLQTHEPLG
jgi:hypothetical protein